MMNVNFFADSPYCHLTGAGMIMFYIYVDYLRPPISISESHY